MCGSKPTDALRTLPERAFRLRARLIAVGLCAVCFAGSSGGCSGCNYAPAAGTPSGRWGSSCETPLCPPTGARYTAPMVRCLPPTAAAGPCAPAPGDAGGKACPCRQGACGDSGAGRGQAAGKVQRPALQRLPFALPGGAGNCRCRAGFLRGKRHHRHPYQSGQQALVPQGEFLASVLALPMWTTPE